MENPRNAAAHNHYDVIVIGAGASGLYCALTAGRRGRRVLVLDHANKAGKKNPHVRWRALQLYQLLRRA